MSASTARLTSSDTSGPTWSMQMSGSAEHLRALRHTALVQRAGKPRKFARARWMMMNARSSCSGVSCISSGVIGGFPFLVSRHRSRGAGAPEFWRIASPKGRGDGAPDGATVLDLHAFLRRRGALRRAVRRSPSASGRAFRDRPDDGRPPSASSWRAARIGRQAEPRRRPGARPARHARGRRPAPHEPAQPVRVPHGSGQL